MAYLAETMDHHILWSPGGLCWNLCNNCLYVWKQGRHGVKSREAVEDSWCKLIYSIEEPSV